MANRLELTIGGALPVIGEILGGPRFKLELEDPMVGRRISHAYEMLRRSLSLLACVRLT